MVAIPLGKISAATPGTPQQITAATVATAAAALGLTLPAGGFVAKLLITPDPANAGTVYVCAKASNTPTPTWAKVNALAKPTATGKNGEFAHNYTGDLIDPSRYAIDVAVGGEGALLTVWVQ